MKASANAVNPEVAINPTYRLSLWYIVCGFPTPGGANIALLDLNYLHP
jgi:hypothetical protein